MARKIQVRRDTAANWTTENPTLAQGEIGLETDTGKGKIGDGSTAWASLAYGLGTGTIHIDAAGEFTEVAEKTTAASADKFLIEDSAAGNVKKYIQAANLPAGVDTTAIHKATPAEISALTQKVTPAGADHLLIEDAADSNNKKRVLISALPTGADTNAVHVNVGSEISGVAEKTSLVAGDLFLIEDSAAGNAKKRVTVANLPAGVDVTAIHKATSAEISALTTVSLADADVGLVEDASNSFSKGKFSMSELAVYVVGKIGLFSVTKNGNQQTVSLTGEDVVNWDTPTINTAGITVNSGLGEFTFTNAGTYEIGYNLTDSQTTGGNRNTAHHGLVLDGALIKGTYGQTYNS